MRDFVGVRPGATVVDVRVCDTHRECTAVEVLKGLMRVHREISKSGRPAILNLSIKFPATPAAIRTIEKACLDCFDRRS